MAEQRVTRVVVASDRYPFPIDMLRYDRLVPASEMDSALITGSLAEQRPPKSKVTLETRPGGYGATVGRWASFGYDVLEGAAK